MPTVSQPGMGALVVAHAEGRIFLDAFTRYQPEAAATDGDLLLYTHADHDHFDADRAAAQLAGRAVPVVGPPSIALPLVRRGVPPERIHVAYPFHLSKPEALALAGVRLTVFNTRHFNDWNPDHVSYLVEVDGARIYVTGDSYELPLDAPALQGLDLVAYSLVGKDRDRPESLDEYLDELTAVQARLGARRMLPNHLVGCEWAVRPEALRAAAARRGLDAVAVLVGAGERLGL